MRDAVLFDVHGNIAALDAVLAEARAEGFDRLLFGGDLVLFDRNNHKSLHQGALVKAGAIPIFLPTARNSFGMIGAVDWDAWDEKYLRDQIRAHPMIKDPERATSQRPFRMACIQLATYDGTVYNVRKVMEKMHAKSVADLGRSAERLHIASSGQR